MSEVQTEIPNFFDLYMRGDLAEDTVHDYIGLWHDRYKGCERYPALHEFLGMTHDEYEVWMYDPFALPLIRQARQGADLVQLMILRYAQLCAANRREDGSIIFSLRNWLQRLGRL